MGSPTLEERLADLGDGEISLRPPPADEVWSRGKRWQRRRAAVSGLAGACVVALVAGVSVWGLTGGFGLDRVEPAPAQSSVPITIPDAVHEPSGWLGPLGSGPVVAISETERSTWLGKEPGVVGIAAQGSKYGFLDLPGYALGAVLSPDGARVAYWASGVPSGDPQTNGGQSETITGVAVHDLVSGQTLRHDFETVHGLLEDDLVWLDERTLVGPQDQWAVGDEGPVSKQGSGTTGAAWWWQMGEPSPTSWPWGDQSVPDDFSAPRDGRALVQEGRPVWLVDPLSRSRERTKIKTSNAGHESGSGPLQLASDGRLAQVGGGRPNRSPNKIQVSRLTGPSEVVEWRTVPRSGGTFGVLGWRGEKVIAMQWIKDADRSRQLVTIDVADGSKTTLVDYRPAGDTGGWLWARDLLETAPMAPGVEPPRPLDPRVVVGLAALAMAVVVGSVIAWRRRGRP